jgi:hypothetical protein|tara:strand:- start:484 stop:705 length:222 start_codon:yes stop_codon:yes gene_type:complete
MKDSKKRSMFETLIDVSLGLIISTTLNFTVLPMYVEGIVSADLSVMIQISIWYTVFAIIRRYSTRRLFERFRR